ncbi:MAG: hypothetical protein EH225_05295 [Calditrichaeota bacterium]|nr:hypothetical protein [Spirochaetales bacterium]RQW04867.1 MAG: hypothetical protein EH225_05295 [Calditrichota bacterium]
MRRRTRSGELMAFSLSELAYVLLFLAVGALVFLYNQFGISQQEIAMLKTEVNFLNEILAEKENGVVPCWRRPEAVIPEIVGDIIIHSSREYTIVHRESGAEENFTVKPEDKESYVTARLLAIFAEERAYAKEKKCYIRMKVTNETNDFSLYRDMGQILRKIGVVLVNE